MTMERYRDRSKNHLALAVVVRPLASLAAWRVVARATMATTATMQRETVRLPAAILVAVLALRLRLLRRAAGDKGRESAFIAGLRLLRARLRRRIALLARLIIVVVTLHEGLRILRQIRLLA